MFTTTTPAYIYIILMTNYGAKVIRLTGAATGRSPGSTSGVKNVFDGPYKLTFRLSIKFYDFSFLFHAPGFFIGCGNFISLEIRGPSSCSWLSRMFCNGQNGGNPIVNEASSHFVLLKGELNAMNCRLHVLCSVYRRRLYCNESTRVGR